MKPFFNGPSLLQILLAISLLTLIFFAFNNFDSPDKTWDDVQNFELSFDQEIQKIETTDNFKERRKLATNLIKKMKDEIRGFAEQESLTEKEMALSRAQLEITTQLRFLDIDVQKINENNCQVYLKRMVRINKTSEKQKSSYRLIRALCKNYFL